MTSGSSCSWFAPLRVRCCRPVSCPMLLLICLRCAGSCSVGRSSGESQSVSSSNRVRAVRLPIASGTSYTVTPAYAVATAVGNTCLCVLCPEMQCRARLKMLTTQSLVIHLGLHAVCCTAIWLDQHNPTLKCGLPSDLNPLRSARSPSIGCAAPHHARVWPCHGSHMTRVKSRSSEHLTRSDWHSDWAQWPSCGADSVAA